MSGSNHTLNLILAILVTLFCCLPLGIAAIVFAAIGMSRASSGDYTGAEAAAGTARILTWVSFGVGLVIIGGYLLFVFAFGVLPFLLF